MYLPDFITATKHVA